MQELLSSNPDALAELTQNVHLPLKTTDDGNEKAYIACSWNRLQDGSYRSPFQPDSKVQAQAQELWNTYKQMYYGTNAVASVYVQQQSNNDAVKYCFLLQHKVPDVGEWNSAHICCVSLNTTTRTTTFSMQSNVLVMLGSEVSAHVSKHTTSNVASSPLAYMETIGPMLESVETELRSSLENVQLPKLYDTTKSTRKKALPKQPATPGMMHTDMLNQAVLARAAMQKKNQG